MFHSCDLGMDSVARWVSMVKAIVGIVLHIMCNCTCIGRGIELYEGGCNVTVNVMSTGIISGHVLVM